MNFNKLIAQLTPTFLRNRLILSFLHSLVFPIKQLYSDFEEWKREKIRESNISSQVISLQAWINYKILGSLFPVIEVKDDPSGVFDFMVAIPSGIKVDSDRLYSFVNKYKTTGKNFVVVDVNIRYQTQYAGYVCEQLTPVYRGYYQGFVCEQGVEIYHSQYMGYVCEQEEKGLRNNMISLQWEPNPESASLSIELTSDELVASDLTIIVNIYVRGIFLTYETLKINRLTGILHYTSAAFGGEISSVKIVSVSPESDRVYQYIF